MLKVQEYINNEYPQELRNRVTKLDLRNKNLEGDLSIENWSNLERLDCSFNQLASIKIDNLPKLNFFSVRNCQLSDININNCPQIGYFNVKKNSLSDLAFLNNLNPESLTFLDMGDNNFSRQDLSLFSHLANLEEVYFGSGFFGSLEPLKGLVKLKSLGIFSSDINNGLEYLPVGLEKIYCHNLDKENDTSLKIWEEMKNYPIEDSFKFTCYNYQAWRKDNSEKIELANIDKLTLLRQFKSIEQEKKEIEEKLKKMQEEMVSLERKIQNNPIIISPNFSNIATGSVSNQQGHALIGNALGNSANFTHETVTENQVTTKQEKLSEPKLEAKIEQPPKKVWKSLFFSKKS